jgi:cytochrome c2
MSIRSVVKLIALIMMLVVTGCSGTMNVSVINMISVTKPAPVGNPVRGEDIYKHGVNEAPACVGCHALTKSAFSLGPVLTGVSERAGKRIEGMSADDYLRHSILEPNAYVVSGFRAMMFPGYAKHLSEQDVLDLIAYLKTL